MWILFPFFATRWLRSKYSPIPCNVWSPFAYSSNARRIIGAVFLSTTTVFVRESLIYPTGAREGYSPRRTFWRNPRFVFIVNLETKKPGCPLTFKFRTCACFYRRSKLFALDNVSFISESGKFFQKSSTTRFFPMAARSC
jgi:hypothetical protein